MGMGLGAILLFFLAINILSFFFLKRVSEIHYKIEKVVENLDRYSKKNLCDVTLIIEKLIDIEKKTFLNKSKIERQVEMLEDEHRILLEIKESLITAKPMKPNNWDSVREVFKGPTKHERD